MTRRDQSEGANPHLLSTTRKKKNNANPGPKESNTDNLYVRFGKEVHRKHLGFGTMGTAFFARGLISADEIQATNEDDSAESLSHLESTIAKHKKEKSIQYHLMAAAAIRTMSEFEEIREDCHRINNNDQTASVKLTSKLKQITRGMKAARQADTCRLKGAILGLARDHAARLGRKLDVGLRKDQRGLKDEATACLFLPHRYQNKYLSNPEKFQAHVDRGDIVINANEWPAFLYNETMYNPKKEWVGLFLGETFVRACICILVGPSAATAWPYGTPSAQTYAASNKKGNADLNDITDITREVVAGLVCQVTFALSDAPSWKDKIGDIDLIELYTNTIRMLSLDLKWTDTTLDTLHSWILGEKEDEEIEDRDRMADERFERLAKEMEESEAAGTDQDDMDLDNDPPIQNNMTRRSVQPVLRGHAPKSGSTQEQPPTPRQLVQPATPILTGATEIQAPRQKQIRKRPSTPSDKDEPIPAPNMEPPSDPEDDTFPGFPDTSKGSRVAKPTSNSTKSPQFSLGFTGIRTSPPSIPQSAQFGTQDRLSTQRSSQSQRHLSQTPAPPSRSLLDTSTTRTPRNKPSTSHQASPARTSQGRRSAPRRTQDPITPSQAGLRSSQGNAGASRTRIPLPKVPAKRPAPIQDNEPFWDSPLTEDSPLPPARRTRSQKRKSRNPGHKSQRTTSQVSEND